MKQYTEVIKDSFVDYAGKKHEFVIAAISDKIENHAVVNTDGETVQWVSNLAKGIRLGIAICNPTDKFDEKTGAIKAIARARNADISLYVSDPGLINTTMVRGLLVQEAEYVKNNPEKYIKGYSEARDRYFKNKKMEELPNKFSEVERIIVDNIEKDPTYLDNVKMYVEWLNKQKKCKKQEE